jgi:hypothetical protein
MIQAFLQMEAYLGAELVIALKVLLYEPQTITSTSISCTLEREGQDDPTSLNKCFEGRHDSRPWCASSHGGDYTI